MPYTRFEELPVWQTAVRLGVRVFGLVRAGRLRGHDGLRDQLERAAVSVSNNIAEGYERGSHDELIAFLYYAKGSAGEVRSMLSLMERCDEWKDCGTELGELKSLAESTSRQIAAWLDSLRRSTSRGPRHETAASTRARDQTKRRDAFLEELRRIETEGRSTLRNASDQPNDAATPEPD